ncbi:MAG: HDOD domain-containing protein [Dehalococcoidia bacterium]|nr:HDOD domain-containing protein [Dehalococcoidia bacterium]
MHTLPQDNAPGAKPGFSALAGMLSRESFMTGPMVGHAPPIATADNTAPAPPAIVEQEAAELTAVQQAVRSRFARVGQELGMSDFAEAATAVLTEREALIAAGQPRSAGHRRFGSEQQPASSAAAGPRKSMLTLRAGLTQVLADPKQLPTVPLVYQKLSRLVADPNASVNQVSEVVSGDPASASRLLQVVNSPFYGMRKKVDTISLAVKLLGFQTVKDLVLAITAEGMFKAPPGIDPKAVEQL